MVEQYRKAAILCAIVSVALLGVLFFDEREHDGSHVGNLETEGSAPSAAEEHSGDVDEPRAPSIVVATETALPPLPSLGSATAPSRAPVPRVAPSLFPRRGADAASRETAPSPLAAPADVALEHRVTAAVERGDYERAARMIAASPQGRALRDAAGADEESLVDSLAASMTRYLSRTPARNVDAETRRLMDDARVRAAGGAMGLSDRDLEALIARFLSGRVIEGSTPAARVSPQNPEPVPYEPVAEEPRKY